MSGYFPERGNPSRYWPARYWLEREIKKGGGYRLGKLRREEARRRAEEELALALVLLA